MKHIVFSSIEPSCYTFVILTKPTSMNKPELMNSYVTHLVNRGVPQEEIIAFDLDTEGKKVSVKACKSYMESLLPALNKLGSKILYVCDSTYFKVLTKVAKAEPYYGYVLPCAIKGFEHLQVVLGVNHKALYFNPELESKLILGLNSAIRYLQGLYTHVGDNLIQSAEYPETYQEIRRCLRQLHQYPSLSCDIETFSLEFTKAGIGTIAFAWDQHNGIAFCVDYLSQGNTGNEYGRFTPNRDIRKLLLDFFTDYKGEIRWHNANYDLKVIIYTLWMDSGTDNTGLLIGLETLTQNFHDTKIIAYLATNSCAGNKLGLKDLAQEFAGNWAKDDIKDIRRIQKNDLLQYNLIDCLCTNYVFDKLYPRMVKDNQEALYQTLMKDSLIYIIQMELTGMPICMDAVKQAKNELEKIRDDNLKVIYDSSLIAQLNLIIQQEKCAADNAKLKIKQHPIERYKDLIYNPNSNPQTQKLLYELMGLPVIAYTEKKQPACDGSTIEALINHTSNPEHKTILEALIGYAKVQKILSAFIPAFENAVLKEDGHYYLHGNFNLGGTVSGRLSCSKPNLQQIPAGSTYAKIIKKCFKAPPGWLFVGADFKSLEDYISALTTKDPNKLKVYLDGYDGHCLRAFYYFRDQMPDIEETVESINSIEVKYKHLRKESKGPTFLLTYGGTYHGLVTNCGFSEEKAKQIEANYHKLYQVSDEWVKAKLDQASKDGYVDVAFGLRLRTPLLSKSILGHSSTLYEAAAESRTAGNALGQSYGLLTNRAANDCMNKVKDSPYRHDIKPVALIHDAIYYMVKDDIEVVHWLNKELIDSMKWQDLPELHHDQVKLGAELDVFYPTWADKLTIPNEASKNKILELCKEHVNAKNS